MSKIVTVMIADRENYTYVPHGTWTTRTLALQSARRHGGEWLLIEHALNREDRGECIWSSGADMGDEESKFYLRFWPVGFPCPLEAAQ